MTQPPSHIEIATAPFLRGDKSTSRMMFEVFFALLPIWALSAWYFGISAILVVLAATLGAAGTEWLFMPSRKDWGTLKNGSALLTGMLLGLTLPPAIPLWIAWVGGAVAIGLGKLIWGGLGGNLFNPALIGRAFLMAAFPVALTTWTAPGQGFWTVQSSTFALPLMRPAVDVVSSASPLGMAKFEHQIAEPLQLLLGNTSGSLGETGALLLIACGLWLGFRRIFDWRLPVSTLLTVAVFSGILHLIKPNAYPDPLFMVLSGGLLFGAVFMVTDPVTTPVTPKGAWVFGIGTGLLVVLIRLFGGFPEGVMYAVLLMNAVTPHINRYTQPRRFGG